MTWCCVTAWVANGWLNNEKTRQICAGRQSWQDSLRVIAKNLELQWQSWCLTTQQGSQRLKLHCMVTCDRSHYNSYICHDSCCPTSVTRWYSDKLSLPPVLCHICYDVMPFYICHNLRMCYTWHADRHSILTAAHILCTAFHIYLSGHFKTSQAKPATAYCTWVICRGHLYVGKHHIEHHMVAGFTCR